jgi:hypothetical protein
MIDNDLIVEIPWIIFGILLAAVCVRLCRFRPLSGRQRDLGSREPSEDGSHSSVAPASAGELVADEHGGPAVSSLTHSTSPASPNQDPAAAGQQSKPFQEGRRDETSVKSLVRAGETARLDTFRS